ncbi:MAG TPA: endonuclease [Dehalococcoidia bacterium]|nr:endonuclease [Dehalococcoidia bacterium]
MIREKLLNIYHRLLDHYGPQHWWPAKGPFEMMVGAVLTQSTTWTSVEKAIDGLRTAGALSPEALRQLPESELANLIFSSGYYNAKARKLKALAYYLVEYQDDLDRMFAVDTGRLRRKLLGVHGIGEETADSILLYAAKRPVFVIDAYTRRIIGRVGLAPEKGRYADYQHLFMDNLPADSDLYNEYHALLVCLGKNICRSRPLCQQCCLCGDACHFDRPN